MRRFLVARSVLRRSFALCVCAVALWQVTAARAEIQVGAAVRVITPDPLLPVSGGMGAPNPSREKKGDLTARAVVFRKGEVSVAVVSLDLLGFPSVLGDRVRAKVTRIPARNILIASTHTHSAPDCYAFPDGKGGHTGDLKYMALVCDKAAEAVNEAIDRLQPAWIKIATGLAEGKIAYNYYAPDLYDRRMSVIQASTPNGRTIATLVNYAIHPEVLGNDIGILSPDLIGPLCDQIESETKGTALFINGAQGGMITADNRDLNQPKDPRRGYWSDSRSWEECLRIGRLMASESLRIIKDAPEQEDPTLFCDSINVRFPVDSKLMWAVIMGSPLKYPHNEDQSINARINLINLGDAQILTIPGEALPNIGFYLKRKMHGRNNLLFGLTNDAFGYILTKVDFQSFPRYDYVSRTSLGEMTGEILIENSLEFVNKSPSPDRGIIAAPAQKAESKPSYSAPEFPAPEVVNAQVVRKQAADSLDGPPFVTARTWAIADGKTGEILWGHDEAKPVDIASTTKIATALVIARLAVKDPAVLNETVTFSERADQAIGSTSGVRAGERLSVRELLFGLLLPSGNDASVALAEHFGGRLKPGVGSPDEADTLPRFIAEMNRLADELALRETHFVNPNGLPAPGHVSSARDLARLARIALAEPIFATTVSTPKHGCTLVDAKGRRRDVVWTNTNRLLETEGYDGVKTGTTRAAGECLVASGRRGGDHVIVVVLGASSTEARYADARNLFRFAWLSRGHRPS